MGSAMKNIYKIGRLYIVSDRLSNNFEPFRKAGIYYDEQDECFVNEDKMSLPRPFGFNTKENVLFIDLSETDLNLTDAKRVANEEYLHVWKSSRNGGKWYYESVTTKCCMEVSADYSRAIYHMQNSSSGEKKLIISEHPVYLAIECKLLLMGYVIVHAACIEINNSAILFSAPSGTGKSTRADCWVEAVGASYISGDRPIIDPVRRSVLGAPWDGKEGIFRNVEKPIAAFNRIQRSEETRLSRMPDDEKVKFLATQTFLPMWDPMLVTKVFSGIKQIVANVSVYHLACDRTLKAAKECYDIFFPKEPENVIELLGQLKVRAVPQAEYKSYIDSFMDFKARRLAIPHHGTFELTPLCNLDCKMCYVHLHRSEMNGAELIPVETWKGWMKEACDAGMIQAKLTGGECLTYPGFEELYLYLQSLGVEVTVFTNGILLDEEKVDFLKKHPVKLVQVTLYGSNEDSYEKVTGVRCFEKVYRNLLYAKKEGLPVTIAITPNVFAYEDMPALLELVNQMGITYNINSMLFDPRENTKRERYDLTTEQYLEIYKKQASLQSRLLLPVDPDELPDVSIGGEESRGIKCAAGRSSFCINWNGIMAPCVNLIDMGEPLANRSIQETWKLINDKANHLVLPRECASCVYKKSCIQCIAQHYNKDNPGTCNKQICERTKMVAEAGLSRIF